MGDSRYYALRRGELLQISRDQTLAQDLVDLGVLSRTDASRSRLSSTLSSAIGGKQTAPVVTRMISEWGNVGLLCSDGLTRMVPEFMMAQAFHEHREPQRICDALIAAANDNGGADNITVVVVEVTGGWWRRLSKRWTRAARPHVVSAVHGLSRTDGGRTSRDVCRS